MQINLIRLMDASTCTSIAVFHLNLTYKAFREILPPHCFKLQHLHNFRSECPFDRPSPVAVLLVFSFLYLECYPLMYLRCQSPTLRSPSLFVCCHQSTCLCLSAA